MVQSCRRSLNSTILVLLCISSITLSIWTLFRVEAMWFELKTQQTPPKDGYTQPFKLKTEPPITMHAIQSHQNTTKTLSPSSADTNIQWIQSRLKEIKSKIRQPNTEELKNEMYKNIQHKTIKPFPVNGSCPASSKTQRYAEANIDTALYKKFWSHPVKCYGTFVELGAANGNQLSNTKFFEDHLGWNGVLIEAFNKNFKLLERNRPNTVNYNVAICPEGQEHAEFIGKDLVGGIVSELLPRKYNQFKLYKEPRSQVPCVPIGPLLRRSEMTKVDLFSLDVEGGELIVLKTMDWSIPVHVFIIEMEGKEENKIKIRELMAEKGFVNMKDQGWNINSYGIGSIYNEVFVNLKYEDQSD